MTDTNPQKPVTVVVIGAGHRAVEYAKYALKHPKRMKVVAVADPNDTRREMVAREHNIPREGQFRSYEEIVGGPKIADAIINGTMDQLHHRSTMPFLEAGYDVLLEKPIAPTEWEVRELIGAAKKHNRVVMICHVLRYAPFYSTIKKLLTDGRIGKIVALHSTENVSYHHMATAFIRGRWNNRNTSVPMMLAKCCHDLDLLAWMNSGVPAARVASFGELTQFKPENAPAGSALRCLNGCKIESTCPYSAKTMYIKQGLWAPYAWETIEHLGDHTEAQKIESLQTDNPYGRCVWHCDNNVVDHQSVIVQFANGVTASHDLLCATSRPCRKMYIVGTLGEIEGDLEDGIIHVRHPRPTPEPAFSDEVIDVNNHGGEVETDGHGGGDSRLIADFVSTIIDKSTGGLTRIEDSLTGHLIAFAADRAMLGRQTVEIEN
ncbi:MAG: Gfo/Idh/MocA family oxidoreductase [Phycisphaerales bacterium]|nr:Gfo/Idh/MocA family oxidoreductase [Phycisphaerales bacterium]